MSASAVHRRREARFIEGVEAFIQRDFRKLEETMHPHLVMDVAGRSWLAGTYRGPEEVSRCILGLRHVLRSSTSDTSYLHDGDHMIVTHRVVLQGSLHETEMEFVMGITFGPDERVTAVSVEPSDVAFFDHVVNTTLETLGRSRLADTVGL
jgi:hypothetical protein